MSIKINKYDNLNGHDLCEIILENKHGVRISLLNYGATLEKFEIPTKHGYENILMSLKKPEDYSKERNFIGATVGRVAGRIKDARWENGNQTVHFIANNHQHTLHSGGKLGLDNQVWDFELKNRNDKAEVSFYFLDPDLANHFPGNVKIKVTYSLDNDNALKYEIEAVSDQLTLFNPTNHTYFRLDGPDSSIEDLNLELDADYYLPVDDQTLPAEAGMAKVKGTVFDFRKSRRIGDALKSDEHQIKVRNGFDHPFILNGNKIAATLTSNKNKRKLEISTNAQALVVFTANGFPKTDVLSHLHAHDGIALEAQAAPTNDPKLQMASLVPGEKFHRIVKWKISY